MKNGPLICSKGNVSYSSAAKFQSYICRGGLMWNHTVTRTTGSWFCRSGRKFMFSNVLLCPIFLKTELMIKAYYG